MAITTVYSNTTDIDVTKLQKELEILGLTILEIRPGSASPFAQTEVDLDGTIVSPLLDSAQSAVDNHIDGQDSNARVTGRDRVNISTVLAGIIGFRPGGVLSWEIVETGHLIPEPNRNIGSPTNHLETLYVNNIIGVTLGGSGSPISLDNDLWLTGKNFADTSTINLLKVDTNDDTFLNAETGKNLFLSIGDAAQWKIDPTSGDLVPVGSKNIGSVGNPINTIFADSITSIMDLILDNNQWIEARNFADNANINLLKLGADDKTYFNAVSGGEIRWQIGESDVWYLDSSGNLIPVGTKEIGSNGSRVSKLWLTDLDITNDIPDGAVSENAITQHEAAIEIYESQILDLDHDADKIEGVDVELTGPLTQNEVIAYDTTEGKFINKPGLLTAHIHDTSDITTGTFVDGRISDSSVEQHIDDTSQTTSNFWSASKIVSEIQNKGVPTGAVIPFAGSSAPSGWLMCDGSAVSQATYTALFGEIAFTYGNPGGGNFNLPNLEQRFPLGNPDMSTPTALGNSGGTWNHTHGMSHTHPVSHTHTISHTHNLNNHTHGMTHTHNLNNHTHTIGHTHSMQNHVHTVLRHYHGKGNFHINDVSGSGAHTHSFSDSFTTGNPSAQYTDRDGDHRHYIGMRELVIIIDGGTTYTFTIFEDNGPAAGDEFTLYESQNSAPPLSEQVHRHKHLHTHSGSVSGTTGSDYHGHANAYFDGNVGYTSGISGDSNQNSGIPSNNTTSGTSTASSGGPSNNNTGSSTASNTGSPSNNNTGAASTSTSGAASISNTGAASSSNTGTANPPYMTLNFIIKT